MNANRYLLASLAALVFVFGFDFLLHANLLHPIYEETLSVWRPKGESNMAVMMVSQLLFVLAAACMFVRYAANKGVKEGSYFGLSLGTIFAASTLGTYMYLPIPFTLTLAWMVGDLVRCTGAGALFALVYKK